MSTVVLDWKLNSDWIGLFFWSACEKVWPEEATAAKKSDDRKISVLAIGLKLNNFWWNLHQTDNLLPYFDEFLNFLYILFSCIPWFYFLFSSKYCRKLSGRTFSAHTVKYKIQKKTVFGSGTPLLFRSLQFQLDFSSYPNPK